MSWFEVIGITVIRYTRVDLLIAAIERRHEDNIMTAVIMMPNKGHQKMTIKVNRLLIKSLRNTSEQLISRKAGFENDARETRNVASASDQNFHSFRETFRDLDVLFRYN